MTTLMIILCLVKNNKAMEKRVMDIHHNLTRKTKKVMIMIQKKSYDDYYNGLPQPYNFLSGRVLAACNKRKKSIISDLSKTLWGLSVDPNVRKYVKQRLTGS